MATNMGNKCIHGFLCFEEEHVVISSGEITVSESRVHVDVESGSTDDLDTINFVGGTSRKNAQIVLRAEDAGRTIVVKDGTGNIELRNSTDFSLDDVRDRLELEWGGAKWVEHGRSPN